MGGLVKCARPLGKSAHAPVERLQYIARMSKQLDVDLIIVGGGLAGTALATALRSTSLRIALIEARAPIAPAHTPDTWDARVYAISPVNQRFLNDLGVWQHLNAERLSAVQRMEIFGDADGRLAFSAYDAGLDELAWIIESGLMQDELWQTIKRQPNLDLLCPATPASLQVADDGVTLQLQDGRAIHARLLVAADGAKSWVREQAGLDATTTPYHEMGVVANFETELPHHGTAWQWFRDDGVLAWLPLPGHRFSMVWSTQEAHAEQLTKLTAEELCERVASVGAHRLGKLNLITPPAAFPLRLMRVPRTISSRIALIGDAAHAIHPLSGHGINLGFQDAAVLAEVLREAPPAADLGDLRILRKYERKRREEVSTLQMATHGLQRLFQHSSTPVARLRNWGMTLTNALPFARSLLARYAALGPMPR